MGYPKDLDEYTDAEIRHEYIKRKICADMRVCSYCELPYSKCNCKMKNVKGMCRTGILKAVDHF